MKGNIEAWSEPKKVVLIDGTWYIARDEHISQAKQFGKGAVVDYEQNNKELTKLELISKGGLQNYPKRSNGLSEDISIRMSALKSAVASTSREETITAEGFVTRAKSFEKYIRGGVSSGQI